MGLIIPLINPFESKVIPGGRLPSNRLQVSVSSVLISIAFSCRLISVPSKKVPSGSANDVITGGKFPVTVIKNERSVMESSSEFLALIVKLLVISTLVLNGTP